MATAIFTPANYFEPLNWEVVFGRTAPVEIDVGCGKGNFLVWAARTRPAHNFLGVDRQLVERLRPTDRKVQRAGVPNVRLLRLEFGYLIGKLIPDHSVTAYYVFFPDPWPKRRHAKHRLVNTEFAGHLARTLRPGGVVNVATDDENYFQQIQKVMTQSGRFMSEPPAVLPEEACTEFEMVFRAQGVPIHRSRWMKPPG
jgi:tRNA (guanine-N7-)-methyltransferase